MYTVFIRTFFIIDTMVIGAAGKCRGKQSSRTGRFDGFRSGLVQLYLNCYDLRPWLLEEKHTDDLTSAIVVRRMLQHYGSKFI